MSDIEIADFTEIFESKNVNQIKTATDLLIKIHRGIYSRTFPLSNEQEQVEYWLENLSSGVEKGRHIYVAFGYNLFSDNPDVVGFAVGGIAGKSSCGLMEYLVRDKKYSKVLSGKQICEYVETRLQEINLRVNNESLKAILWEANNPEKIRYDENNPDPMVDCMSPKKRCDLIENRYGGKRIGIDYVQGPLSPCKNEEDIKNGMCETLILYLYNADNYHNFNAKDLYNYICCFNEDVNGVYNPYDFKHFGMDKMMRQLQMMTDNDIPLLLEQQTEKQIKMLKEV